MTKGTVSIKFEGDRFKKHTIPLELLSDLSAINKMVIAVASYLFTEKTGRQRVPKGFRKNNYLSLKNIGNGSAVADLDIEHNSKQQSLFETQEEECISKAFETVMDFINGDLTLSQELGEIIAPHFNSIGLNLRPGDNLYFQYGSNKKAVLNVESRLKLVNKRSEYADNVKMYGIVSEMDRANCTFKLTYKDSLFKEQRVEVNYSEAILGDVLNALSQYDGQKISIYGRGQYKDQKLLKIDVVEEFQKLDPLDVSYRLNELLSMEDGWMEDGSGIAPDKEALLKLAELFDMFFWSDDLLPYIYPTPSGDIEMEWKVGNTDFILDVVLSCFKGKLVSSENDNVEIELDLGSEAGWNKLNGMLKAACN